MKERQRWRAEEDAILSSYVKQYGPREWHLVSQRMNATLDRDAKSCLERWKNYLKPGIKKGSLTEEEQQLVICLQAKHGNKWKKIAAEVPGRTAKRLGKWWEVFREKQQRGQKENTKVVDPIEESKYDHILENFAQKLAKEQRPPAPAPASFFMATSNGPFLHTDPTPVGPPPTTTNMLPPWLSNPNSAPAPIPPSPSVTLTLSPSSIAPSPIPWLQQQQQQQQQPPPDQRGANNALLLGGLPHPPPPHVALPGGGAESLVMSELVECCRELEEGHRGWIAHKKEASWRLRRVELQLESEKACRKREKMGEIEAKMKVLRKEEKASLDRIEAEYREQLAGLRRDAEAKQHKLAEQWAAKHSRLTKFLEQMGCRPRLPDSDAGRL